MELLVVSLRWNYKLGTIFQLILPVSRIVKPSWMNRSRFLTGTVVRYLWKWSRIFTIASSFFRVTQHIWKASCNCDETPPFPACISVSTIKSEPFLRNSCLLTILAVRLCKGLKTLNLVGSKSQTTSYLILDSWFRGICHNSPYWRREM